MKCLQAESLAKKQTPHEGGKVMQMFIETCSDHLSLSLSCIWPGKCVYGAYNLTRLQKILKTVANLEKNVIAAHWGVHCSICSWTISGNIW